ncbi:exodeoxyribonuclease VII large subunit [Clostridium vincentii]|uniref:Exodeoxyribonuclease 7 large subunit n=1 Tax=Clostridium vincentii TaxID=52704 RepID=A0A2T0BGF0_9CLOT|nr:exodeoxyribonuclease VII large subunit [Clostridium vincentii]PRR82965.1 Exodeoxyribonuclease 7 large subunit [Clostridium vincentii]
MKIKTLSVSEVNNYFKRIVDNDFILNNLSVKGEISNLKYHSSGHIYFSLKDGSGRINCVMFKNRAETLKFRLEEGMSVITSARASVYTANGSFQLYCDEIEKEGLGQLYITFERLKEKLNKEGYFSPESKKPMPTMPERIGVVTSATGAAVRDIINVTRRRNSLVDIVIYPAQVQGTGAYRDVIKGIKYFNKNNSVDVIIIGRGGGSIEDLWNFNEEELAMEIFKSKILIISAVGHEVDFTISDFVSDIRAATPSQAAEIAVYLEKDIYKHIEATEKSMKNAIEDKLEIERAKLVSFESILKVNSPINKIVNSYLVVDGLKEHLNKNIKNRLRIQKERLSGFNNVLMAHNPTNLLNKGYAIIENNEEIIKSVELLNIEKDIKITLRDGSVKGNFKPFN